MGKIPESMKKFLSEIPFYLVSNRGPYEYIWTGKKKNRRIIEEPSMGGLATSLDSVMMELERTWIGWGKGNADKEYIKDNKISENTVKVPKENPKYDLQRVFLTKEEDNKYYNGFCNRTLWPLFHEIDVTPIFDRPDYWKNYKKVNEKFAEAIPNEEKPLIWIHDYHLALVPRILKEKKFESLITFFWHIPWPSTDRYIRCPWRTEILEGMLGSDIIGFHLDDYVNNFLKSVETRTDAKVNHDNGEIMHNGHKVITKDYPISIDFEKWEQMAKNPITNPDELYTGKILFLSVDRLDYTKGIIEKLKGIERFLEKYNKIYKGNIVFALIAAPSRINVREYKRVSKDVDVIAERVNNNYSIGPWKPIELIKQKKKLEELAVLNRRADASLTIPHHDGMNQTAKEYVGSQVENKGVLILSEFAGAAKELGKYSILVNPFNIEQVADSIHKAATMPLEERIVRMRAMRNIVKKNDLYKWTKDIMNDAIKLYKSKP